MANKTKLLSLVFGITMCFALMLGIVVASPTSTVYAEGGTGTTGGLTIGGESDMDGVGYSYKGATQTLTLQNYNGKEIDFSGKTIKVEGNNTITVDKTSKKFGISSDPYYAGINSRGAITITGSGSLAINVETSDVEESCYGISADKSMTINGGNISININSFYDKTSIGLLSSEGFIKVEGSATLDIKAKTGAMKTSNGDIILSGTGEKKILTNVSEDTWQSYGIYAKKGVMDISGSGKVTVDFINGGKSWGIRAEESAIKIHDKANVEVNGAFSGLISQYFYNLPTNHTGIEITDSTVKIMSSVDNSGTAAFSASGNQKITIKNSVVTAESREMVFSCRDAATLELLGIVVLVVGGMRTGKTTCVTDIGLSLTTMFRRQAMEILIEIFLKYPNFPWIVLERQILKAMENHSLYNLATCKHFTDSKRAVYEKESCPKNMFGYDFKRYGVIYDDSLSVTNIWGDIGDYVKAYFIYVIECSLLITNYGVREDCILNSLGNFPLWNDDFFKKKSAELPQISRYSHIVDYDCLRLGMKVVEDNVMKDSFDFGVVLLMEIGKERGNNLELKEVKKVCYSANQKNDLFDAELKMMGHAANVRNKCFVRFVCDEQRPESWGANARELASIVRIEERGEQCIAMPFYEVRDLLYAFLSDRFKSFYLDYRFARGDISLLFYLYSNFFAAIYKMHLRNYNTFGYSPVKVQTEKGTLDGVREEHEYYYLNKKIYSSRFATDGFSGFYYNKTIKSGYGIGDMPCYADIHATEAELEKQNSYFVRDLTTISGDEENGTDERF